MKKSLFLCMWLRLYRSITSSSFVLRPLSLIAYANPLLYVALLALHITAPLEFTVTPLRPPLDDLAVATATAEGGASVAGRGVPVALASHGACAEIGSD